MISVDIKQAFPELKPTVEKVLAERGRVYNKYGPFKEHAVICQNLKDTVRQTSGWTRLSEDKRQALETIMDKIARILTGDPEYTDNWIDIQGYAKLAEEGCKP